MEFSADIQTIKMGYNILKRVLSTSGVVTEALFPIHVYAILFGISAINSILFAIIFKP